MMDDAIAALQRTLRQLQATLQANHLRLDRLHLSGEDHSDPGSGVREPTPPRQPHRPPQAAAVEEP